MDYQLVTVIFPCGVEYPAVKIGDVYLAHPNLTSEQLKGGYLQAVLAALMTEEGAREVKKAANTGIQLLLKIGLNWKAPMSVYRNSKGEVAALLHFGPN